MPLARQTALDALPPLHGRTVLDLGCGPGREAAVLAARGAAVIGVDAQAEPPFIRADLRSLDLDVQADGIWSSFAVAYLPDLVPVLRAWKRLLKPGGWIALLEIDDLFGHEPLSPRTNALFEALAADALANGRYDFRMGRKLARHLEAAGFTIEIQRELPDDELSFDGPARPFALESWRARFQRLPGLRAIAGSEFEGVRDEFLACLTRDDHRSTANVCFVFARCGH